jgi:hypothetical protein
VVGDVAHAKSRDPDVRMWVSVIEADLGKPQSLCSPRDNFSLPSKVYRCVVAWMFGVHGIVEWSLGKYADVQLYPSSLVQASIVK